MPVIPKAFPPEFRRDVAAVARKGEAPIAKDFGISESCLHRWLKLADIDDGVRPGTTSSESAELRELRKTQQAAGTGKRDPAPGGGILRQGDRPKMMYPLVGDPAADGIPVAVTCRVLGFSKQPYYAWCAEPVSQRDFDDAHLINAALDIHHDDPAFGYRFIADELPTHGSPLARTGWPGSAHSSASGPCSANARASRGGRARRCTATWCNAGSPPTHPTRCA